MEKTQETIQNQKASKDLEDELDQVNSPETGNLFEESKEVDVFPEFGDCGGESQIDSTTTSAANAPLQDSCCKNT